MTKYATVPTVAYLRCRIYSVRVRWTTMDTSATPATPRHEPCVVVGAGPVGVVAALALRRRGVDVLVVESQPQDRQRPGSRALVLAFPTLRRLDAVLPGLGRAVSDAASGQDSVGYEAFYEGKRIFRMPPMPSGNLIASLPQTVTETIVYDAAVAHGVRFCWNTPVTDVATDADGVTITLASGERIRTPYVIAADGARSAVRKALGISMSGHTDATPFIIVDVDKHPDGPTPPGCFHYRNPDLGGRNLLRVPFAGGIRLDLQCLPTDDAEHLASPEGLREWLPQVVDPWHADHVQWVSTYLFHQVVADTYTDPHRRVLLAGEAAHLFAPFGARGLNSGVMDATDAAKAVSGALTAPDQARAQKLVQRCANDRRQWGLRNRAVSNRALRTMRADDPRMRARRAFAARIAPAFWPAGAWLATVPMQPTLPKLFPAGMY